MKKNNESLVYSVEEAAVLLGIGRNSAYNAIHSGDIPSFKIGRSLKIPKPALDALLDNAPAVAAIHEKAQAAKQIEILRVPRTIKRTEPKVGMNILITVSLNNKLVEAAIARGVTLAQEVRDRLAKSFDGE